MPRPTTLPEPWRSLAEMAGGVGALAEKFGVTPGAISHWAWGRRPLSGPAKIIFEQLKKELDGRENKPQN